MRERSRSELPSRVLVQFTQKCEIVSDRFALTRSPDKADGTEQVGDEFGNFMREVAHAGMLREFT
jgi:hypothetical protein